MAAEEIDPRAHQVLADVSRVAVLETLRRTGRPLTVTEIAEAVGLHPNTVRSHLMLLTEHGHITTAHEQRERPGRPRVLYSATVPENARRDHRLLAEILIAHLATREGDPHRAAVEAGHAHGHRAARASTATSTGATGTAGAATRAGATGATGAAGAATRVGATGPAVRVGTAAAIDGLVGWLAEMGFAPRPTADGVELHHCPFRELAENDAGIVCGVHLGMVQGFLAGLGAPVEAVRLLPFVRPGLCVAELRP